MDGPIGIPVNDYRILAEFRSVKSVKLDLKSQLTGTHSQWTQYMTPKGGPRSGCHVCSSSNVWSPKRHSAKRRQCFFRLGVL